VFASRVWGLGAASDEVQSSSPGFAPVATAWRFFVRWVCPLFIALILVTRFLPLG
jgi:SNF family Na+-dependent transporter